MYIWLEGEATHVSETKFGKAKFGSELKQQTILTNERGTNLETKLLKVRHM
jgi:hypothetical protein